PVAPFPNARQTPSADSAPPARLMSNLAWCRSRFTPPTIAAEQSPDSMASHARCSAVRLEEHAVSTVMLGPDRFIQYDTRFAMLHRNEFGTIVLPAYFSSTPSICYIAHPAPTNT